MPLSRQQGQISALCRATGGLTCTNGLVANLREDRAGQRRTQRASVALPLWHLAPRKALPWG